MPRHPFFCVPSFVWPLLRRDRPVDPSTLATCAALAGIEPAFPFQTSASEPELNRHYRYGGPDRTRLLIYTVDLIATVARLDAHHTSDYRRDPDPPGLKPDCDTSDV